MDPRRIPVSGDRDRPHRQRRAALQFNEVAPGSYAVTLAAAPPVAGGRVALGLEVTPRRADAASAAVRVRDVRVDE